jgi:FeS assembly SUF system protein
MKLREAVIAALRKVRDPELPVSVYDLGLIYGIEEDPGGVIAISMTLTAPNCPTAEALPADVERAVRAVPGVTGVRVELTFDPPWSQAFISPAVQLFLGTEHAAGPLVSLLQ